MNDLVINEQNIQSKIFFIRNMQVMIDRDLAKLYGVETRRLNEQVKRNSDRFPDDFMFQLSHKEFENWKSQNAMSNSDKMGLRRAPYVFTEQGVSMLSSVLKSKTAVDISVKIIRTFIAMRKYLASNSLMFERFERIEQRLSLHDDNFNKIFNAIKDKSLKPKQGIFYDGQTFDAYVFVADLTKSTKSSIILIDNFVDETVLLLLSKRASTCKATIYTKTISKQLQLDLKKHNEQYPNIEIKKFNASHDIFLIIDEKEIYHIGASLKDLGKKWFGFSKMDSESFEMMRRLR